MKFIYKAKNQKGEIQMGSIEATSFDSAIKTLGGYNLFVMELTPVREKNWLDQILGHRRGISGKDLTLFMRQFATLLESRVPLSDSLKTLLAQTTNPRLKETLFDLVSDLDAGLSLSQAMARQSHLFNEFYIQMVRSGEISGRMEEVFTYLADYTEHQYNLTSKAKGAAVYPAFILGTFLVIGTLITVSLAPQMAGIFGEFEKSPPLMTKILISIGQFLANWGIIIAVALVGLILALLNYFKTPEGRRFGDFWLLRLPIFGNLYRNIYVARFCETAGTLIRGAIPITSAFEVAGSATGNYLFEKAGADLAEGVRKGESVSVVLARYPEYFPPMVSQMAAIGETSGRLDDLLLKISTFYQAEVERAFSSILDILQPVLIILVGLLVGLLVAAVLLPIYQLAQSI